MSPDNRARVGIHGLSFDNRARVGIQGLNFDNRARVGIHGLSFDNRARVGGESWFDVSDSWFGSSGPQNLLCCHSSTLM